MFWYANVSFIKKIIQYLQKIVFGVNVLQIYKNTNLFKFFILLQGAALKMLRAGCCPLRDNKLFVVTEMLTLAFAYSTAAIMSSTFNTSQKLWLLWNLFRGIFQ